MAVRVQVILTEEERERFRRAASRRGLSLSAWLRAAGIDRLAEAAKGPALRTRKELKAFFAECDRREASGGREPDWAEHAELIAESRLKGLPKP